MKKILSFTALLLGVATAMPLFAQRATSPSVDGFCMQRAVAQRREALVAAFDAYNASTTLALEERGDAEIAAWRLDDPQERERALSEASRAFDANDKFSSQQFSRAKQEAWTQFDRLQRQCTQSSVCTGSTTLFCPRSLRAVCVGGRWTCAPKTACTATCPDGTPYNSCVQYFADPCLNHRSAASERPTR